MNQLPDANDKDNPWRAVYITGGVATLLAVFVFRRNLGAELGLLSNFGIIKGVPATPLSSALDWFNLLQANRLVGLTLLNFFDIIEYGLVGLMFLALYIALRQTNKSAMVMATSSGLAGMTVYFASNQAFAMLALSERYAAATSDLQRSIYLAAGEALLAISNPEATYQVSGTTIGLFLVLLAGLIISLVMLRSEVFSKATGITGILANGIGLCYFIGLAFAWELYWLPIPFSAPFRVIWYFLIGIRLLRMAKS